VLGLSDFSFVMTYDDIAVVFDEKFSAAAEDVLLGKDTQSEAATKSGKEISDYLMSRRSGDDIADLLIGLFRERICRTSEGLRGNCSQVNTQP
jgi:hypothetical protein